MVPPYKSAHLFLTGYTYFPGGGRFSAAPIDSGIHTMQAEPLFIRKERTVMRFHHCCENSCSYSNYSNSSACYAQVSGDIALNPGVCHPDPYYRGPCAPGRDYDCPAYSMPCSDHICPRGWALACSDCGCDVNCACDACACENAGDFVLLRAGSGCGTDYLGRLALRLQQSGGNCFAVDSGSITFNRAGRYMVSVLPQNGTARPAVFVNGRAIDANAYSHSANRRAAGIDVCAGDSLSLSACDSCACGDVQVLIYRVG